MISWRKYFRLLPAVLAVGVGVLTIKGIDLARAAQASTGNFDAPDNSGLAPADAGGTKPTTDFAADAGTADSSAEVDVLTSLTHRRAELDARERALNMRENVLVAGEARVDQKITALTNLQSQIQALLSQRDAAQDKQLASLVKTYSSMKPKDAARIFDALADEVLLPVAKGMKSDVLAPVMAAMNPEAAQKLTVKLAALLKLPEMPPAAACPNLTTMMPAALTDSTPLPLASATVVPPVTPPSQTAVVTPPPVPTPTALQAAPPAAASPAASAPAQATAAPAPKPHKRAPRKVASISHAATPVTAPSPATVPSPATAPAIKSGATPSPTPVKPDTAAVSTPTQGPLPVTAPVVPAPVAPSKPSTAASVPAVTTPPASGPPAPITAAKGG